MRYAGLSGTGIGVLGYGFGRFRGLRLPKFSEVSEASAKVRQVSLGCYD